MKLILIFILNLLCGIITAQQIYFNKRIDYNNDPEEGMAIIHYNDTSLIVSGTFNVTGRLAISFLDSVGNVINSKIYGDNAHHQSIGGPGDIISTFDGGFACVGTIGIANGHADIIFYKFNSQGDTEWTRTYGDTLAQNGWQVKQTHDGGYIITGITGTTDTMGDIFLLKLDNLGNEKWWKYYGGIDQDCGISVIQTTDGGYFISGYTFSYGPNPFSTFGNCYVVKTDSLGNQLWDKVFGGQYGESFYTCIETMDSGLIAVGAYTNSDPYVHCCHPYGWPYFVKLDFNGNIIWEKKIGSPYYNTIGTSIRELPDGNLIASGSVYDTTIYKNKGLIIKLSSQGDSLWDRMYEATPGINSDCFLNDIAQTEDKGFIAIGVLFIQAPDTGTQDTWILKVDSNGCEVTNCSYMGIINTQSENGSIVSVYPNPFNSAMIIKIESESNDIQGYITITDIFGREIFRQELFETENKFEFNGSHLDPGIYFVSLINKAGLQSTVRIVKI